MIVAYKDLPAIRAEHRHERIALGGGTFDIVHPGHIAYLHNTAGLADITVISISNDSWFADKAGAEGKAVRHPLHSQLDRAKVIDAIKGIDYVLLDPYWPAKPYMHPTIRICQQLHPDVHLSIYAKQRSFAPALAACGTELVIQPRQRGYASSATIRKIQAGVLGGPE